MATITTPTLVNMVRRFMRDWPDQDVLTASVASNGTTLTVADGTIYPRGFHLEIDSEVLTVATTGTGTSVPVRRAAWGTTAASHVTASSVLIGPNFPQTQIVDALDYAVADAFPLLYKEITDTSLTTTTAYEYTIPNIYGSVPIQYISTVELKPSGETDYRLIRDYSIIRGATPKIKFHWQPDTGATMRVRGYGPFQMPPTAATDLDILFPDHAIPTLILGAASYLTMSGETGRVRADTGIVDQREQANRVGSSMSVSNSLYQRFRQQLNNNLMPRMPIHSKPTF